MASNGGLAELVEAICAGEQLSAQSQEAEMPGPSNNRGCSTNQGGPRARPSTPFLGGRRDMGL